MKTIEIVYGNSLKINRGNYEQEAPLYSLKTLLELNGETPEEVEKIYDNEFSRLKTLVDKRCLEHWNQSKIDLSGMRIRVIDGIQCPSVTSILSVDSTFKPDPQYGERGKEIENIIFDYIDTGKWREPAVALSSLTYSDIKYKEFFEKFKDRINWTVSQRKIEVFNKDYRYSGEIDFVCEVDGLPTIIDFKTGQWNWAQLIAYHFTKQVKADQLAIFDFKQCKLETLKKSDEKYSKGLIEFFIKRGMTKAIYGI